MRSDFSLNECKDCFDYLCSVYGNPFRDHKWDKVYLTW